MAGTYYIRIWCGYPCYAVTTHRRMGQPTDKNAQLECAEHCPPLRDVDWVGLAVKMAQDHPSPQEERPVW